MDDIQQQLQIIDDQLRSKSETLRDLTASAPLIFIAIGVITGICISQYISVSLKIWFYISLLFFILTFVVFLLRRKFQFLAILMPYAALLCALSVGSIRLINYKQTGPNDISNFVREDRGLATVRGIIISRPYTKYNTDWAFNKMSFTDPPGSFYIKLTEVQAIDDWTKVTGKIRVQVNEPVMGLDVGDKVQIYCWLNRFEHATNPGQFDLKNYLQRRNIHIGASVKSREGIELIRKSSGGLILKLRNYLYNYSSGALFSRTFDDNEKGLLNALLLGYRGNIDSQTYEAFRKTGLLHFISLSGMHLGILIAMVWWFCARLGLLKPKRALVCIIITTIFLLIVPPREPTLRAAIVCFVFCASAFFRRYPSPINSLSLAAIILLLVRPTCLFEAGWQLSFACVLGILLFSPRFYYFLNLKLVPAFIKNTSNIYLKIIKSLWIFILVALSTGFSAWLGSSGILLYHFYTINPLTCIWTIIVFPFVALILCIGYLQIFLTLLFPSVSSILAFGLNGLVEILTLLVEFVSSTFPSEILVGKVPFSFVLFIYASILIITLSIFNRIRMKKLVIGFIILSIIVSLGFVKGHKLKHGELQMTVLDVGHGQALVFQSNDQCVLFDAGSLNKKDIGNRIVVPFLRYSGISDIDAMIISHQDIDHINGMPEIANQCTVKKVYASEDFVMKKETGMARFLSESLKQNYLDIQSIPSEKLNSRIDFKILWPIYEICGDDNLSENDKSIVALITFAERKILITSDIEQFAQEKILEKYEDLTAEVVIVPHHGSATSFKNGFLDRLNAKYLICSCSRNRLENLENRQIENLFITPCHGAISININQKGEMTGAFHVCR